MTTAQKIIKYLALAFATFLCVSIITGICGALFTVANLFGADTESEMVNQSVGSHFTSISVNLSAAELEIKTGDRFAVETDQKYLNAKKKMIFLK